jgi:hypothetical protein
MAGMVADSPATADAASDPSVIHPDRTLWLLSIAHAVNHAQAVLLPLVYVRIIAEFRVSPAEVADELETLVSDEDWPLPKYRERLFAY